MQTKTCRVLIGSWPEIVEPLNLWFEGTNAVYTGSQWPFSAMLRTQKRPCKILS